MGCCFGVESRGAEGAPLRRSARDVRADKWRTTGIVGVRNENLKVLPKEVLDLKGSLRNLDASHNKIASLPLDISNFSSLQRLSLEHNLLQSLPPSIGFLKELKVLILDSNSLESLPVEIGHLLKLEKLSASHNRLSELPNTFNSLTKLRVLNVSRNNIKALPPTLGGCHQLEEVDAAENVIDALPNELSHLTKLKSLVVDNNRIQSVPTCILTECVSLQTISLHGNPITLDQFQETPGFAQYEARRKGKIDKQIATGVMLNRKGLDEGVDVKKTT